MNSLVGEVERLDLNHVALVHHGIDAQYALIRNSSQFEIATTLNSPPFYVTGLKTRFLLFSTNSNKFIQIPKYNFFLVLPLAIDKRCSHTLIFVCFIVMTLICLIWENVTVTKLSTSHCFTTSS